jgi:hypothetical protein
VNCDDINDVVADDNDNADEELTSFFRQLQRQQSPVSLTRIVMTSTT